MNINKQFTLLPSDEWYSGHLARETSSKANNDLIWLVTPYLFNQTSTWEMDVDMARIQHSEEKVDAIVTSGLEILLMFLFLFFDW